jgi:hypothetical protein
MPRGVGLLTRRSRRACRSGALVLALAAPALVLAQVPISSTPANPTPAAPVPAVGAPSGSVPGASLPGLAMPGAGGFGAATGLTLPPADYTEYGASVGVGETDNVTQSPAHPKSQTLAAANLFFDVIRSGSRLQLSGLGNFSDIDYLEHAYGNQVLGRFDGFGNLALWQRHLTWLVQDSYGDQEINPLESMTPTNLQRVNILSTGPSLTLQPTLSSFVRMQALYSRTTYQSSPFDQQAGTGSLTLGHNFSELSSFSVVAEVQQLRFDNGTVNRNYQTREYFLQYEIKGARTAINVQAGGAETNDIGTWRWTPMATVSLTRNVSPFSTLSLDAGRNYQNASQGFAGLSAGAAGGIPIGSATQTTANAVHTYGTLGWEFQRLRTTFGLSGGWSRNQYDRQSLYNVTNEDVQLDLGRKLTPLLSANLTVAGNRQQYLNQGFTNEFGTVGAGLTYRPGRWLVIYGTYTHELRRSSGIAARGVRFDENRGYIMIGYYPHSHGTASPGSSGGMGMPGMP